MYVRHVRNHFSWSKTFSFWSRDHWVGHKRLTFISDLRFFTNSNFRTSFAKSNILNSIVLNYYLTLSFINRWNILSVNVWFFQENGPLLRQPRKIFAMSCQLCLLCGACEHKRVIVIHNSQRSIIIYWQFCTEGGRSGAHGGCLGGGGQGLLCANDPGSNSHLVFIPLHF